MTRRVILGDEIDLDAQVVDPSAAEKVGLIEARKQFIAEIAKNWIVVLAGTVLAVFFLGAGILGLIDGSFDELAVVADKALPMAFILIGYAVGQKVGKGNSDGKGDE